ncbi:MAG: hypothetical protein MRERV_74c007 [Mycoplasmataceae bacterium RV_VA103A]|nr:MAG: hypothetical protein MRERV_74c007 [Mycoplasmataceae bacterium RV_VA103A]
MPNTFLITHTATNKRIAAEVNPNNPDLIIPNPHP